MRASIVIARAVFIVALSAASFVLWVAFVALCVNLARSWGWLS